LTVPEPTSVFCNSHEHLGEHQKVWGSRYMWPSGSIALTLARLSVVTSQAFANGHIIQLPHTF
jgi:hypothetical protein